MAIHFFKWLTGKTSQPAGKIVEIDCQELLEAAQDFYIRDLCFQSCVDMIANAIGRCEFRTYRNNEEVREFEYYMLNIEPNVNQNSTEFWHKVIFKLYAENEVLIISTKTRDGRDCLVCADSWTNGNQYPVKQNEYSNVQVGSFTYTKTFREKDVIHLKLNEVDIKPVLDGLFLSYSKLLEAAKTYYITSNGTHMKVHINQISQAQDGWEDAFKKMLEKTVVPFLKSNAGVLPEFDGYDYSVLNFGSSTQSDEVRKLTEDIFNMTARAFLIPVVLINGNVEGTADANKRFLTYVIDPLCDQIQEELNRKRYGYESWRSGSYVRVDSSSIIHFDVFENASNIEKVVGSGVFSLNDVLRAANQTAIPEDWANRHYMTLNISAMGEQTRQLEGGEST
jgi:HK97 family phage portal protein